MNLYLDCEFNGFGGALIAMALVPEDDGEPWYEVLPCAEPVPWVQVNVLPVLGRPPLSGARALTTSLSRYLDRYPAVNVIADWPEDLMHFCRALLLEPGNRINTPPLTLQLRPELSADSSLCRHNALEDAKALRLSAMHVMHPYIR